MDLRGCIPFISSDHAKSPFLSLFYNLQTFHLHAYSTYLPAAASFSKGQQIRYCASNSNYSFSSVLISSDALLTSNPKEPCPRHHGNQSRMHLGPFVLSHLIMNCMYLAIDMRLYQILTPICILADLACLAARPDLLTECRRAGYAQSQGYRQAAVS